ncbi:MAG TPA: hypothetical protein V6C85_32850 [Allocoleopsis sp.]
MASSEERKRQILDHISRTTKLPQQLSATNTNSEARKQQIMDHIKRTRG